MVSHKLTGIALTSIMTSMGTTNPQIVPFSVDSQQLYKVLLYQLLTDQQTDIVGLTIRALH